MRTPRMRSVQSLLLLRHQPQRYFNFADPTCTCTNTIGNRDFEAPPELDRLKPSLNDGVITADTISQSELTIPSLWWAKEQFGWLLDNWLAYPGDGTTAA